MSNPDLPLSIALGVGLAAATGFRIFLPMLIVSVAAHAGHLSLDERFAWLATSSALITLSVAAFLEIVAYYVPVVDNLLDTLATPASLVAGTVVSAAVMTDVPPMVKWTAAVIAGAASPALRKPAPQCLEQNLRSSRVVLATWSSRLRSWVVRFWSLSWRWPRRLPHSEWLFSFYGWRCA